MAWVKQPKAAVFGPKSRYECIVHWPQSVKNRWNGPSDFSTGPQSQREL